MNVFNCTHTHTYVLCCFCIYVCKRWLHASVSELELNGCKFFVDYDYDWAIRQQLCYARGHFAIM